MNYQTIQIYNLMANEFAQVEGDFLSLRESDIKSVMPAGMRCSDFLEQLRSGHQVLLTETPSIPLLIRDRDEWGNLYWRVNSEVEPQLDGLAYKAYTARADLVNHGIGSSYAGSVNASVYTEPYVERNQVKLTLAERLAKQRQERLQELENIQLPPSSWQDTFNKPAPKPQQVFAKSSLVPCDSCDIGTEQESLTDIGQIAAYGAVAMNNTTALTGEATFVEASGSALKSLSGFALRAAKVGLSPATAALALFMPTKVADSTLYHAEDLRHMAVANTNIRLGFNPSGQIYGYHVKGAEIPVRHVKQVGEKFVVALESDHTLEWVPMQPEDKESHLTTSPIPALDSYHIWIHPEHGEVELAGANGPYTTPIHQINSKDYILTFPAESGIPPVYVVYSVGEAKKKTAFTGRYKGEEITLKDVELKNINYIKRDRGEYETLRSQFNSSVRKDFLKSLTNDPVSLKKLKEHGVKDSEIAKLSQGKVPRGYQVHHKIPLDDGGTNDFDNLVLIRNSPEHSVFTTYQKQKTTSLSVGESHIVQWPSPNGKVYPTKE
ncbi:S-type pyocin domain-containing protein [Vibrio ruber]|uniref:S-type pyocin domain-containing protein n=1 Tax=Vibrio ruber TaxID=184755 RepID=UPI002892AF8B|nr:S-type pyocin domain-containing protein [Vibrio ruber]WNJ94326.1 S-type pyocin domain-containing protein [Vibrio ruber]